MALVEGKLYNCTLPQEMWWYLSTYTTTPPSPGAKVGLCQTTASGAWAIILDAQIYRVWLPGVGGGKWAKRTPDDTMIVTEPYTYGSWRAPGS